MKFDPHNFSGLIQGMMEKMETNKYGLREENRKLIMDFYLHLRSQGYKNSRICKYLTMLRLIDKRVTKPFDKMTKEDVKTFVIGVESTKYSNWTKHDYKVVIRSLFKWMKGNNESYPEEVDWIKVRIQERHKLPEELLTEDEMKRMFAVSSDPRDRALVQCLYETGCRISELLTVQLKNIQFDEYGAVLRVIGKTGTRRVRIVASVSSLATWMDMHPFKDDPDAYLFVRKHQRTNGNSNPFRYSYAAKIIKDLAAAAGIKKRVHPHLFRHSRATALANKLTEAQMKEYFGWTQSSDMASVYVHLSGRDVDDAILGLYGLRSEEKKKEIKLLVCPRCSLNGSPGSKFCTRCGYTLGADVAIMAEKECMDANNLMNQLMKIDPGFKEMMMKKIIENKLEKNLTGQ
ncbi:MAG: tyrosine-type recombinase/integrase [Candidatus Micrarchaeota archaeon]|nr:tyrosine-type recombinase/integrase [Candidatus Micrarchaeota archaeon]